jgi:hypothetical protein
VRQGKGVVENLLGEEEWEKGKFGLTSCAHLLLSWFEGIRKSSIQYFVVII